jgi:hypothetical protein
MLEHAEQKRTLKLKTMFRQQIDTNQPPSKLNRKKAAHLHISPPVLQHSTSIYSLVSPTRTAFIDAYGPNSNKKEIPYELYQPLSPPPPIPQQKSPWSPPNSLSPLPPSRQVRLIPIKKEHERPMHPLDLSAVELHAANTQQIRSHNCMRYADARRTVATDPREQLPKPSFSKKANRRHSCSSTVAYKQQQQQQQSDLKDKPTDLSNGKSFRSKLKERRRSSKVGSSSAAASIEIVASKSTPSLRKVKTYNVPKKIGSVEDVEKQRKMQELEDLISGRRGSTLKLTLTPKGLS